MASDKMHPFGREEEDSLERLFVFFCESIRQGQWDLALACIPQLRQWQGDGAEQVKEILQAIVACPYKLRWESTSSPHHLAWLWLREVERWWPQDQVKLYGAFLNSHNLEKKGDCSQLSLEALSFLWHLLRSRPRLMQAVVAYLLIENPNSVGVEYNYTLQKQFVDFLRDALCSLKEPEGGSASGGREWTVKQIYSVVSVLTFNVEKQLCELRQLCEELYDAVCTVEYGLSEERLLGCMLRNQDQALISLYTTVATDKRKEKFLTQMPTEKVSLEVSEAEKMTLALFTDSEELSAWKTAYFYCTSNSKHFLEQVLITGLGLIKRENYCTLSELLKRTFKPLARLLVLLGWTCCRSLESAQSLLRTLHEGKVSTTNGYLILRDCFWHVSEFIQHLYSVDCHSALYSLNRLTNLPALKVKDVTALLQKQPANFNGSLAMIQRRNLTLYQAFSAIKYAIYSLCVNAHEGSQCIDCPYSSLDTAVEDALLDKELMNDQLSSSGCSRVFKLYFIKCQAFLRVIPAPFRLEVLENIFSLLFLTYSDLCGDKIRTEGQFGFEEEGETEQIQTFESSTEHPEQTEGRTVNVASSCEAKPESKVTGSESESLEYLDLKHFVTSTKSGSDVLVDEVTMSIFLEMIEGHLVEMKCQTPQFSGMVPGEDVQLMECLSCSISVDAFENRLAQLSRYISEALWRYKVVMSNKTAGNTWRKKDCEKIDNGSHLTVESMSGDLSPSTSDGSVGNLVGTTEQGCRSPDQKRKLLIPLMLAPPESLLISCILRGNFTQAHQVALMFNMQSACCYGELVFMERYQQVISELAKVEQKMENTTTDNRKLSGGGRFTLQAIGNAAAAGMVFYSISDVVDKLINSSEGANSALLEDFWKSKLQIEPSDPLRELLEDLSAAAMAVFDLACTQCQLWKTCKQLLETAERRLMATFETKSRKIDSVRCYPDGIQGFPAVLQQISKILNCSHSSRGPSKPETEERAARQYNCSITELLLTRYPVLTEDCITSHLILSQCLENIMKKLEAAMEPTEIKGNILTCLMEQTSVRSQDSEGHPVRNQMKQLLKNLDQQIQTMKDNHIRADYVRSLFDYINTLAAILVRSMNRDLEVKVGNPFLVLRQTPSQLLAHLLFEKPASPDRLFCLLQKEELNLNIQKIIVSCCCEHLPLWNTKKFGQCPAFLAEVTELIEKHTKDCLPHLGIEFPSLFQQTEENVKEESRAILPGSLGPYSLIPSALSFLKSRSKLLAVVVCLTATRGQKALKQNLSWKERLSGRTETPFDMEQISKECEQLMKEFPVLEHFLAAMAEPLQRSQEENNSLVSSLCGNPYITLMLSGLHSKAAVNTLIEGFRQVLSDQDWPRALRILDVYGEEIAEFEHLKDILLSCAAEGWKYHFRVQNAVLRGKLTLCCLEKWPLDACLEVLSYCLSDPGTDEGELKSELHTKRKELQVYEKSLLLCSSWQELQNESSENPQTVMDVILRAGEFELCESWVQLHPVSTYFTMKLRCEYLLHLLEQGDGERAFQLLQGISDHEICRAVCEQALDQHPGLATRHFLANYLTTHFHKSLSAARCHEIQAMRIGSKLLLTLPESARDKYSHLSSNPLLMLEQLLMNLKVDWATVAVRILHHLLVGQEAGFAMKDIDALLSKYAAKALEVPYAVREKTRSDSVINLQDLLTQSAGPENLTILSNFALCFSGNSSLQGPPILQECLLRRSTSVSEFVPPEIPPAKDDWVPDDDAVLCMVCWKERFTMFNRRHHCRRCGRVVCNSCSINKMVVEDCRENPARVCDQCYNVNGNDGGLDFAAALQNPLVAENPWCLTLNESENENERSEFFYEQAPSASLCIAIFNLHSDSMVCGHQLIDHCSKLSRALTNPEMDACLLMDIMKQLLFSAKMMFVKAGRSQDLALCDSYISKVDVVKILVAANYQEVPSLEQILKPAAITRLRNKLLETEYYALAVEVSTKSGLDPGGVWHAWGLACLKAGNLSAAREKFSRCLKPPLDRNQLTLGPPLLKEIVQHLETCVKPVLTALDDDILASLRELEATLNVDGFGLEIVGDGKLKQKVFYQECLFYLQMYGPNLAIICFYMRHNCMREALQHLLDKECPDEVFIDGIFVPSYETGKLHFLENLMENMDSSLESWSSYLIASCKHLQTRGFFNILYDLQRFMKDHMRSAMTCIRFFSHKADSYSALGAKQAWLIEAKGHLKTYLQEVSSRSSVRKKTVNSFRKKMSAADVSRYINTIELQIEVTKFLHRCESSATSRITGPPVSLFGNNNMKMAVACKVLLGGKNIEEGFGISFRIIQDFQLDAAAVYNKAAKHLLHERQFCQIRQLLKCVRESGVASTIGLIGALVFLQSKELEKLILEMKSDENKIKAFMICNKYRSAYLVAVKFEPPRAAQVIQEVLEAAERAEDDLIPKICRDWLSHSRSSAARYHQ
uniref:Zinc finger FYVE domain-containing protein 26 n=1 Tax=Callorhinchus milii TaxID=7868 RepID=A0A4W3I267_CALMI